MEKVQFISNYYDGALEGVAEFNGVPHLFVRSDEISRHIPPSEDNGFDEHDYETDLVFNLYPLPAPLLADLLERHAIFERWHQAYASGEATIKDHPALPADRLRRIALDAKLNPWLEAKRREKPSHVRLGQFHRHRRDVPAGFSDWQTFEVEWHPEPVSTTAPAQG